MSIVRRFEPYVRHLASRRAAAGCAAILTLPLVLFADVADAHFRLVAPANVVMQSSDGSPQKMGPCGNEAPQTPSNVTTSFRPGDVVTVQLEETVYHPGHYRVALAVNSPDELPAEPPVTAGATQCGSVPIQQNPTFPILADGMLKHSAPLSGTQTFEVKLPTNVSCTACTLQIIEFMSEHGAPCFYHHCAKISIQGASDAGAVDAARDSSGSGGNAGTAGTTGTSGSGGAAGNGGAGVSDASGGTGGTITGAGGHGEGPGFNQTDDGCGCSLVRRQRSSQLAVSTGLAFALSAMRRRRRRWTTPPHLLNRDESAAP